MTLHLNGVWVDVEVTESVHDFLIQSAHKEENLRHEQRRHWTWFGFDERYLSTVPVELFYVPDEWYCRCEQMALIRKGLQSCSSVQRERFLLHAIYDLSYAEIAHLQGCSKAAVRDSIEAVRKKVQKILK